MPNKKVVPMKKKERSAAVVEAEKKLIDKASKPVEEKERQGDMLHTTKNVGGVAGQRLLQLIERIERLEEERAGISDDIRDVYAEAKSAGFETKIMRQCVRLRKMDSQKRVEQDELLDLYKSAIGLL